MKKFIIIIIIIYYSRSYIWGRKADSELNGSKHSPNLIFLIPSWMQVWSVAAEPKYLKSAT